MATNITIKYTTEDELEYLRDLHKAKKLISLIRYAAAFPKRSFSGSGMEVDKRRIAKELRIMIGPDIFNQQGALNDQDLVRMAREWLEGGNLRYITQQNQKTGEG